MKMGKLEKLFVNSEGHSRQVSQHAEKLLKLTDFKAGQKYLDVGCGNGAAAIHLAQTFGLNVTGVDVDPEQIQIARANSQGLTNARFMSVDGAQLPFAGGEFDLVFTNKVTHHIPNWQGVMAEMIRVLKLGGYFIYADLVLPTPLAVLGASIAGNRAGFPTRKALEAFVAQNNLSMVHLSTLPLHYEGVFQRVGG